MADIRCSRCGHFAFPSGLSKEYKKWGGEVLCDSCYADLTREIESLPEEARKAKEEAELAAIKAARKEREDRGQLSIDPSSERNTVATVLKVFAIINAIVGVILAFSVSYDYYSLVGIIFCACLIGVSFIIYAFGEVIELLHAIKLNTRKK